MRSDLRALCERRPEILANAGHGIEKEGLRVSPDGYLSSRAHPAQLGSALTHPNITTDFSEAQLELITGVQPSAVACLNELDQVQRFVYSQLGDELIWPTSMPCMLGEDDSIPLGQYGSSNIAQAKTLYRSGLGVRYGRLMQTISGIHYNFSLPDAFWDALAEATGLGDPIARRDQRTTAYFDLIRNFRRHAWLLLYLFGASPAICRTFIGERSHSLATLDNGTLYLPQGTSLRMGPLGYQSDAQAALHVSYNSLADYAATIVRALTQAHPPYREAGVKKDGEFQQLNDSIIQIENEFYGAIRPKQPTQPGERPLLALKRRGVAYVEVRCLDLNPFEPLGMSLSDALFIDTFLVTCLLKESPADDRTESERNATNQRDVVTRGRAPGLTLMDDTGPVALSAWAERILDDCAQTASLLDAAYGGEGHSAAVRAQRAKVWDPEQTPSAQVLRALEDQQVPFFRFAMNAAKAFAASAAEKPLSSADMAYFTELATRSLSDQASLEAAEQLPFELFLRDYLALSEEALA
ncbi:MAG: glutamate--cysteine ligase [Pseudomonadota bacterium]